MQKNSYFVILALLVLSSQFSEGRPQFWNRFRDAIFGHRPQTKPGSISDDTFNSTPPPQQQSSCDKGDSYSPDNCNRCVCVGKGYRCTLKYCDNSLANLPAFQP